MFIVLVTKQIVQMIYFGIKTHNFFIVFTIFCKNIERVKRTTIFKYFTFGKYSCLDTIARVCCMHVFLVNISDKIIRRLCSICRMPVQPSKF